MPLLSAILITYNEERDLPQALASLHGLADEIVVVDSGSTDRTCELARQSGARVAVRALQRVRRTEKFRRGAGVARLGVFDRCRRSTERRVARVAAGVEAERPDAVAYQVARRANYLGKWIRHSGWYPEYHLRLYRRDRARFAGALHESLRAMAPRDGWRAICFTTPCARSPSTTPSWTFLPRWRRRILCAWRATLARRDVRGGAVDVPEAPAVPARLPGRLPRRTDRLDLCSLRVDEVSQAGQVFAEASSNGAPGRRPETPEVRVLLVDLESEWRGGQSQALLLLQGLRARGHDAELLSVSGAVLAERARSAGVPVHIAAATFRRPQAARLLRRLVTRKRFDVVHANEAHALTAAWLARVHHLCPAGCGASRTFPLRWSAPWRVIAPPRASSPCRMQCAANCAPRGSIRRASRSFPMALRSLRR